MILKFVLLVLLAVSRWTHSISTSLESRMNPEVVYATIAPRYVDLRVDFARSVEIERQNRLSAVSRRPLCVLYRSLVQLSSARRSERVALKDEAS